MILGCRHDHLRNCIVTVNGRAIQVGDNGLAMDVLPEDADKLLQSPAWYRLSEGDPPLDYTRERDLPPEAIPRDVHGQVRAIDLPEVTPGHTLPAPTLGSAATPGIAPPEAAPKLANQSTQSAAHLPDGTVVPVKPKRKYTRRKGL